MLSSVVEQRHAARHGGRRRLRSSDEEQTGQAARLTQRNASLAAPSQKRVFIRSLVRLWHFGGEVFEDFPGFREDIRRDDRRAKRSARKGRKTLSVRKDTAKCGVVSIVRHGQAKEIRHHPADPDPRCLGNINGFIPPQRVRESRGRLGKDTRHMPFRARIREEVARLPAKRIVTRAIERRIDPVAEKLGPEVTNAPLAK
jgi:hypothetical protein